MRILSLLPAATEMVLVVEWLDPVMVAGHWVPEMVEKADGEMLITKLGEKSHQINLAKIQLDPDILIISPCGFDIERNKIYDLRLIHLLEIWQME